ncbi:hypothetical protein [Sphingomonas sp. GM_Shp_1]|uniref:hypothetical protein n=1 Tax=Sphingomonas sp. GM_Shp_1 TaxID=2937381 RepID=UPI00226B8B10|nr:hypothetical protein [Sphingomonas sp. GM_Shp_1]
MRYDAHFAVTEAPAQPIRRRRWVRWALAFGTIWPVAAALAVTVARTEPDWGLVTLTFLNIINAFGLSPFARTPLFLPGRGQYDEFEAAALGVATARAHALIALLLICLTLAAAWAGAAGSPVAVMPKTWLLWAMALAALFTTLPALFAEISIPLPEQERDA